MTVYRKSHNNNIHTLLVKLRMTHMFCGVRYNNAAHAGRDRELTILISQGVHLSTSLQGLLI
jgi:hypothetical protein